MTTMTRDRRSNAAWEAPAGLPLRHPAVPELLVPGGVQRRAGRERGAAAAATSARSWCCSAAKTARRACSMRSARTWARTSATAGVVEDNTHPLSVPRLALRRRGALRRGAVREQDPAAGEARRVDTCRGERPDHGVAPHGGAAAGVRAAGAARSTAIPAWTPYVRQRWKIRTHNQEMARERRRLGALQVRARHAGTADDAGRDRRPHPARAVAGELRDAAGHGRGRHRVGLATASASGRRASRASSRRCSCQLRDADRRRVRGRAVLVHGEEDGQRRTRRRVSSRAFIKEIERQLGQDIPIWENKVMKMRPVLCDGDGPVGIFRRWAKQFYVTAPRHRCRRDARRTRHQREALARWSARDRHVRQREHGLRRAAGVAGARRGGLLQPRRRDLQGHRDAGADRGDGPRRRREVHPLDDGGGAGGARAEVPASAPGQVRALALDGPAQRHVVGARARASGARTSRWCWRGSRRS